MNKSGTGEAFDIVKGIDYAVEQGADVINLSLSGEYSETLEAAVEKATKQGVVVVAAAGNGGGSADASYPAALPNVISVGSITDKDQVYSGSNSGSTLDIVAPGVNILSATTKYGELGSEGGFYGTGTGTSYATPHVAAVVALYKLQNSEASAAEVQQVLESTATDLNTEGWDAKTGYGKVNAAAVLAGDIELAPLSFELPKENDNVLNTTTVQVTLTNPEQVDKTVFYVDSISTATEIGEVEGNAVTASIEWNTTNVTDGEHAIIAVTYNASGEKLAELTRTVTVRNNPESGYMFTVKTPGNTIAKGASVRLLDKVYDEETNTYNYKELYTGTTNSEGVVRVPSNIGTDLKTLQVVVQGKFDASTEANGNTWFMYSREVSGAGSITLESEDTVPVAMNTIDKAGKDVASAQYFIAMKDAEGIALGSTTMVNSDGATTAPTIYLDKGAYNVFSYMKEEGKTYFMSNTDFNVMKTTEKVEFNAANTGEIAIDNTDTELENAVLYLYDGALTEIFGDEVLSGQTFYVSPGEYDYLIDAEVKDTAGGENWIYVFANNESKTTVTKGEKTTIQVGGNLDISKFDPDQDALKRYYIQRGITYLERDMPTTAYKLDKAFYTKQVFSDKYGNVLAGICTEAPLIQTTLFIKKTLIPVKQQL